MRLDLEEYDFSIEYIQGKQNSGADALSRVNFSDIKDMAENINILKVTTRLQSNKKNIGNTRTDDNVNQTKTKPRAYETITANDAKKLVRLTFTQIADTLRCSLKKGKRILTKIAIDDFIVNGKIDLDQFLPKLERIANVEGIKKLQLSLNDKIFENTRVNKFKDIANNKLNNLEIALTPKIKTIVDENEKLEIIRKNHDDPLLGGHPGITRLLRKLRKYYYWKNMTKQVTKYVKNCVKCQLNKVRPKHRENLTLTPNPAKPFDIMIVDTIGPFIKSNAGNEYAVTMLCDLSKYLIAVPIRDKSAKSVAKAIFMNCILKFGPMKTLLTDMGTEYKNQVLAELCKLLGIEQLHSTAYHHETLGAVERSHRTFNEYLRTYLSTNKTDWDEWVTYFEFAYNTTPSSVHGYCPFELVFGKPPTPLNFILKGAVDPIYNIEAYDREVKYRLQVAHERAKALIDKVKNKQKERYDKTSRPQDIKINDMVLVENTSGHKLDQLYTGPFRVIGIEDKNVVIGFKNNKTTIIHKNRVKLFHNNHI